MITRIFQYALVAGIVIAVNGIMPTTAHALLFNWSFTSAAPFENPGATINGTIDSLVEGTNSGVGLIVEVTFTPNGEHLGGGWVFVTGPGFVVTGGQITLADAFYRRNGFDDLLSFGSDPLGGTILPELFSITGVFNDWGNFDEPNTFTPDILPIYVPEPGTLALFGLGLAGIGFMRRKRAG